MMKTPSVNYSDDPAYIERFYMEEWAGKRIQSDTILKIIDFGSVKIAGIQEISTPVERIELLGTKNYTAPEYLLGMEGSNRSDIYSLGILVYNLLTGHLPYGDKMSRNLNWRTLNKIKYESSIKHNPMIPLWMDGAIHKAVNKDQRSRYDTFSEFLFDLTHPKESFMGHSAPLLERNPASVWKITSGLLLLGNFIWLYLLLSLTNE